MNEQKNSTFQLGSNWKNVALYSLCICLIFQTLVFSTDFPRGKVGKLPQYPDLQKIESNDLVLLDVPTVKMKGDMKVKLTFKTKIKCPATKVYYGVFEPDQLLQEPRYRRAVKEDLDGKHKKHKVTIDLKSLMNPVIDVANLADNQGGIIAYRIEIYNPKRAQSWAYNGRFAFQNNEIVPVITQGPFVDQITDNSAVISWDTDLPVRGIVHTDGKSFVESGDKNGTHFEVNITDLKPNEKYLYEVEISADNHTSRTREFYFKTPGKDLDSFSFAVMGDSRVGVGGGERQLGGVNFRVVSRFTQDAFNRGIDFFIHTGDMVNGNTTSSKDLEMQLDAYKNAMEPVGHYIPFYEVMGNHELTLDIYKDGSRSGLKFDKTGENSSEACFARAFVNPTNGPAMESFGTPSYSESVYHFDYGHCRFIVFNNNYWFSNRPEEWGGNLEGYVLDEQFHWLLQTFLKAGKDDSIEQIYLFAQEPMFPNGGHVGDGMWYNGGDPERNGGIDRRYVVERRDKIWEAFCATGKAVAANFGDEHCYHRTLITSRINHSFKQPVWQIVSGGAGAPFYMQEEGLPWTQDVKKFSTQSHYTLFRVDGSRVTLNVYSLTGQLLDEAVLQE